VAIISAGTDWRHLFLSSGGRLGRGPFALAIGTIFLLFVLADFGLSGLVRAVIAWAVFVVLFFSACCLLAKRLHDRGRSGWWTAPLMAAFMVIWPDPEGPAGIVAGAVLLVAAGDLLLMPSVREPNRFGPPPAMSVR
jgi:uncharacterized membrane protein YhaH (DUF805 family)